MDTLFEIEEIIETILEDKKPLLMSQSEILDYERATFCHICEKPFTFDTEDVNLRKVRDHDHIFGNYLGPAHSICNLLRKDNTFKLPLYCHNAKNYDHHFIIKALKHSLGIKTIYRKNFKFFSIFS
jgi:hypothetical protein